MDWQAIINLLVGAVIGLGGIIVKLLHGELKTQRERLDMIPTTYVLKQDFRDVIERIGNSLERIEDKLDRKANI